ncbi:hypothetical protein LEP1GSC041_1491 [Leptospira noguchii str. 2006001870]|nr:hypothetical protein LEP1GSC041_1491 [Leptospira noguchii str. 2006001870]
MLVPAFSKLYRKIQICVSSHKLSLITKFKYMLCVIKVRVSSHILFFYGKNQVYQNQTLII